MKVRIWGARGSHVTPLSPEQVKSKISTVLGRLRPEDLRSNESKERFLSALPEWLFGTVGGNTPCVEIVANSGDRVIVDAGTGLIRLGDSFLAEGTYRSYPPVFHIFFSHYVPFTPCSLSSKPPPRTTPVQPQRKRAQQPPPTYAPTPHTSTTFSLVSCLSSLT